MKVETKSMLQFSESMNKMQDSSNSLTSIESMFIQNQLEDFEDEELSYEFKTLEYIGQVIIRFLKKIYIN